MRRRAALTRLLALVAPAAALAVATPVLAYLPPASAILKRVAQHRSDVGLSSAAAAGKLLLAGEAAQRATAAAGLPGGGAEPGLSATLYVKAPGKCRLELGASGGAGATRPAVTARGDRVEGHAGLGEVLAVRALTHSACLLLGDKSPGAQGERALGQRLAAQGVSLTDVALGRVGTRIAWVLGGRPQETVRPQAWIDKDTFQPVRLVSPTAGTTFDVRLLDFGVEPGTSGFPRVVEVWSGSELQARFTLEKLTPNARIPDALF